MFVTQIVPINKSRCRVVLEDGSCFVLYRGEVNKLRIEEGSFLSEEARQSIMDEILPKRARLRSLNLLKARDYTKRQLGDKLKHDGYSEEIIVQALTYVESYGYIDDERYARNYITYHMQDRGRTRIEQDLYRKGIDRGLIRRCLDNFEEDGQFVDELSLIRKLLEKKNYRPEAASCKEKQKMYAFLYRRGFCREMIGKALLLDMT